ncbi:MAG: hypothetical protein WC373_05370 [Smithella sp.]|jgi:hypothetical protein
MIRLSMLKDLSGVLLSVLLAACLFFTQGTVAVVYSEGVTISYGGFTLTAHGADVGTQTAPTVPSSSGIQDSISSVTSAITSAASIPATSSATTSLSTSQKYTTTPPSLTSYNTPEHTTELLLPVKINPLSGDEPLLPLAEPYAVTVCLSYNDMAASCCADKKSPEQASEKLAAMILKKYLKGMEIRPFRVVMPSSMPSDEQTKLLRQIETGAITIIETRILKEGSQQRQNIIIEDAKIARQEAQSGANWSHNLKNDRSTHNFHAGEAFSHLNNISIYGR